MKRLFIMAFLLSIYSQAEGLSNLVFGALSCYWNDSEDSCHRNGCIWQESFYSYCSDHEHYAPKALLETLHQQRKFERSVQLLTSKVKNPGATYPEYKYEPSDLSYYFGIYGSNGHRLISKELRDGFTADQNKPLNDFSSRIQEMNLYILLLPKSTEESVVYRGLHDCPDKFITHPSSFVSTSFDRKQAKSFSTECLLEILLPKGFPFISPNGTPEREAAIFGKGNEKEIMLPSHVLNEDGKLVPIRFEILERGYENIRVRPAGALTWDSKKESIEQYEKRYIQAVCKNVHHLESLRMCKKAKEYYNIHTHDEP